MVTEIDRDELKQKLDHPKKSILVEALPADHFRKLRFCLVKETPTQQPPETESWNPRTETEMSASHGLPGHIPAREVLSLYTSRRVPISSWFPRYQNADTRAAQSGCGRQRG